MRTAQFTIDLRVTLTCEMHGGWTEEQAKAHIRREFAHIASAESTEVLDVKIQWGGDEECSHVTEAFEHTCLKCGRTV